MLVAHLPPTSQTRWAADPASAEEGSWSRTDHLLAGVFDRLGILGWQIENLGRRTRTRRPDPLPRPGIALKGQTIGTPRPLSEVRAILASSAPGSGEESSDGS